MAAAAEGPRSSKPTRLSAQSRHSSTESLHLPSIHGTRHHYGPRRPNGYVSPLAEPQVLVPLSKKRSSDQKLRQLESNFINDAIWTNFYLVPRKIPVIPQYDGIIDPATQGYFDSPLAQRVVRKTRPDLVSDTEDDLASNPGSSYSYRSGDSRNSKKSGFSRISRISSKLSARRKLPRSPSSEELRRREESFLNDAIQTERRRTKYRDIIPAYDASEDKHVPRPKPRGSKINIYQSLRPKPEVEAVRSPSKPRRGSRDTSQEMRRPRRRSQNLDE